MGGSSMKKIFFFILLMSSFLATVVFSNVPFNKQHLGMTGVDKARINCVYCHKKAGIKKAKGLDVEQIKQGKYCKMGDCH
jgi:hypothetical protein